MTEHYKINVAPSEVKKIALIGTGTIGSGWAAHFLACGFDVIATDPGREAENKLRNKVKEIWPLLAKLGLAKGATPDRLQFVASINKAVKNADFIQESVPEREDLKDSVTRAISDAARPDVVIASSTSGIVPSRLQLQCLNPERMVVGHPFNPVYLIPLVEVVGGKYTSRETIGWTMEFYQHWGKTPLHCRAVIPGHLANRLQDALGGEMMNLIAEGVATPSDLDTALSAGPGLRWALLGSFMIWHMAAGEGGLGSVFNGKFGGVNSYIKYPDVDEQAIERVVTDVQSQVAGRSLQEMERMRDDFLVGLLKLRADIEAKYGFNQSQFL